MNSQPLPTPQPTQPVVTELPDWSQLPVARRRELTATLAAIILKQLPVQPPARGGNGHE